MHHIWLPLVPPPPTSYSNFETTRGDLLPGYEWPLKPHQCVQEIASYVYRLTTAQASATPHFLLTHNIPSVISYTLHVLPEHIKYIVIFYSLLVYCLLKVLLGEPVMVLSLYHKSGHGICIIQRHYQIRIIGILNAINEHNGCWAVKLCQPLP